MEELYHYSVPDRKYYIEFVHSFGETDRSFYFYITSNTNKRPNVLVHLEIFVALGYPSSYYEIKDNYSCKELRATLNKLSKGELESSLSYFSILEEMSKSYPL